ncbi:MAG: PrgI family protein [Clostridia bacterium]
MGRTYTVPRNVKGESRFLLIFSMRSFITTALGAFIGFILSFVFNIFGLTMVGWIVIAVFAVLGFCIGTLTIPDSPIVGNLRKAGGEKLGDILIRTITFRRRKKIYVYREGGKK